MKCPQCKKEMPKFHVLLKIPDSNNPEAYYHSDRYLGWCCPSCHTIVWEKKNVQEKIDGNKEPEKDST